VQLLAYISVAELPAQLSGPIRRPARSGRGRAAWASASSRSGRSVSYVDVTPETWTKQVLAAARLGPYVDEHLATVARLHRENRYDRMTTTVEEITGRPAEAVEEFVTRHLDLFAG